MRAKTESTKTGNTKHKINNIITKNNKTNDTAKKLPRTIVYQNLLAGESTGCRHCDKSYR